ncbi:alpha/beta fold hydrolase [Aliikangiella coralliicola]|uniref:Alpha/beta hydrolase n=1 Tax=Aliikangiella coralliicola TaxID=2592383 RepID=A0A545UG35_9GAMM|nr:alpha/beta hydrolase [Aliikangiella coralliicola]TQV88436.1 alpha/beta hydrolase [Aliikangiella coralliicola]
MSSKIYFSNNQSRSFSWWLTRALTSFILYLPQKQSLRMGKKLLLKPVRRTVKNVPSNMQLERIVIPEGEIQLYKRGQGPIVLLSHGWSGSASQMFPLMEKISKAGYQAVAFDQLAHGRSSSDEANLFLFIKTMRHLVSHFENRHRIEAVVCHSMAAAAALNAITNPYPMLLIAPVFDFLNSLFEKVVESGVPKQLLVNVLNDLEKQHDMKISQIDPRDKVKNYPGNIHIVHDRGDRFTPHSISETMSQKHQQVNLVSTNDLGHGRIINSDETWQVFTDMINEQQMKVAN